MPLYLCSAQTAMPSTSTRETEIANVSPPLALGTAGGGAVELAADVVLDVGGQWRICAVDQVLDDGDERRVLAREPGGSGAGRVVQADRVVGEVRHLDHTRPRADGQACLDVLGILGVLVAVGIVDRVGNCGDESRGAWAELLG